MFWSPGDYSPSIQESPRSCRSVAMRHVKSGGIWASISPQTGSPMVSIVEGWLRSLGKKEIPIQAAADLTLVKLLETTKPSMIRSGYKIDLERGLTGVEESHNVVSGYCRSWLV